MIRLLVGMCGAKTETLVVVREFTCFIGTSKVPKKLHNNDVQIVYLLVIFHSF